MRWTPCVKKSVPRASATRPRPPAPRLDLHLALHLRRRVNAGRQISFLGRSWHIAPTHRASITLIHHPRRQFWSVTQAPATPLNTWAEILGNYSLGICPLLNSRAPTSLFKNLRIRLLWHIDICPGLPRKGVVCCEIETVSHKPAFHLTVAGTSHN
jgi:hypothetical protein